MLPLQLRILMLQTLRVLLYALSSAVKQCRLFLWQMSLITGIQGTFASMSKQRRLLLALLGLLVVLLYMWPSWLHVGYGHVHMTPMDMCIDAKLQPIQNALEGYNSVRADVAGDPGHYRYLPFVGNGYIGATAEGHGQMYLRYGRVSVPVQYFPYTTVNIEGLPVQVATVIDLYHGSIINQHCYQMDRACVSVTDQTYAHRAMSSVFVQEFRAYNPTETPVTIELQRTGMFNWPKSQTDMKSKDHAKRGLIKYTVTSGIVPIPDTDKYYLVVIAAMNPPESVTIKSGGSWKHHTLLSVKHSEAMDTDTRSAEAEGNLRRVVEEELMANLDADVNVIRKSHGAVWRALWSSGFGISRSRAPGSLNGDKINSTIYYILSHLPSPLHDQTTSEAKKQELAKLLYFPDRCYDGHHTLQNQKLWAGVTNIDSLRLLVQSWLITLEKQGCSSMLQAGADGALQAMILSLGALKFARDHLEFGTHPSDLHRDYFFRRINYGNNTHLNISVTVGEDNKANLFASLDRNDRPYYACDAGCVDPPVKLSNEWTQFPVKLTDPLTAILYITADRVHMEELKHAIHIKKIIEAPAHEHSILAQHRHGHSYGGLPMFFWVSIGFLIVIFHLFLFKLIFNEYCNFGSEKYYSTRSRYSV